MSFLFKCASAKPRGFSIQQSQACAGFIPESQLKSKISHSLIHIGFIGLVTWSGVRGLWKKGLERLKEFLRVILSKNLGSLACTLVSFNSWVGIYSFCLIHQSLLHFCAFLVKSGDLLSLFFFTRFWQILLSFSFHFCPTSCICCLHCSSHRFSGSSYFVFVFFVLFLENKYDLARRDSKG